MVLAEWVKISVVVDRVGGDRWDWRGFYLWVEIRMGFIEWVVGHDRGDRRGSWVLIEQWRSGGSWTLDFGFGLVGLVVVWWWCGGGDCGGWLRERETKTLVILLDWCGFDFAGFLLVIYGFCFGGVGGGWWAMRQGWFVWVL